jgi:ABC-type polar amino acid transport system ATPase subunit
VQELRAGKPVLKNVVGVVFQQFNLLPRLSVMANGLLGRSASPAAVSPRRNDSARCQGTPILRTDHINPSHLR